MSGCDQLPPAPPLQSWSFRGSNACGSDFLPVPTEPQVIQVGLCTTTASPYADYDALLQPTFKPQTFKQPMSVHSPMLHWQDWAWDKPRTLEGPATHLAALSTAYSLPQTGHSTPTRPVTASGSPKSRPAQNADPGPENRAPQNPGKNGETLQTAERQTDQAGYQSLTVSRPSTGASVNMDTAAKSQYANLLTAILPSSEDGKLHGLVSQLRAALRETEAEVHQSKAQAHEAHAALAAAREGEHAQAQDTSAAQSGGGRNSAESAEQVAGLVLDLQSAQTALAAARKVQAEERDRLSLEAAQARLLCKARARRVGEVETELQQLHMQLQEAKQVQQALTAAAADSALHTQQAQDCRAQGEQEVAVMRSQLQDAQEKAEQASKGAKQALAASESAQRHAEWQARRIAELEAQDDQEQSASRRYEAHLSNVEAQFGAEKAQLTAEIKQLREQALQAAPGVTKLSQLEAEVQALRAELETAQQNHQRQLQHQQMHSQAVLQASKPAAGEWHTALGLDGDSDEEANAGTRSSGSRSAQPSPRRRTCQANSHQERLQSQPVQAADVGTQTQLATGASALVAAARDEILRLRELNQRLLDRQNAGAEGDGGAQAKLQAFEVENRVLQERLALAESACQLARSQMEDLASTTGQEVAHLKDKLAQHQRAVDTLQAEVEAKKDVGSPPALMHLQTRIEDLQKQAVAAAAAHRQQVSALKEELSAAEEGSRHVADAAQQQLAAVHAEMSKLQQQQAAAQPAQATAVHSMQADCMTQTAGIPADGSTQTEMQSDTPTQAEAEAEPTCTHSSVEEEVCMDGQQIAQKHEKRPKGAYKVRKRLGAVRNSKSKCAAPSIQKGAVMPAQDESAPAAVTERKGQRPTQPKKDAAPHTAGQKAAAAHEAECSAADLLQSSIQAAHHLASQLPLRESAANCASTGQSDVAATPMASTPAASPAGHLLAGAQSALHPLLQYSSPRHLLQAYHQGHESASQHDDDMRSGHAAFGYASTPRLPSLMPGWAGLPSLDWQHVPRGASPASPGMHPPADSHGPGGAHQGSPAYASLPHVRPDSANGTPGRASQQSLPQAYFKQQAPSLPPTGISCHLASSDPQAAMLHQLSCGHHSGHNCGQSTHSPADHAWAGSRPNQPQSLRDPRSQQQVHPAQYMLEHAQQQQWHQPTQEMRQSQPGQGQGHPASWVQQGQMACTTPPRTAGNLREADKRSPAQAIMDNRATLDSVLHKLRRLRIPENSGSILQHQPWPPAYGEHLTQDHSKQNLSGYHSPHLPDALPHAMLRSSAHAPTSHDHCGTGYATPPRGGAWGTASASQTTSTNVSGNSRRQYASPGAQHERHAAAMPPRHQGPVNLSGGKPPHGPVRAQAAQLSHHGHTHNGLQGLDLSQASPEEAEAALDALLTSRFEKEKARMLAQARSGNRPRPPWDSARDSHQA